MFKIYTIAASTLLLSCSANLHYLGGSYQPTKHVDVYVEATAIKKPYTIIGKGIIEKSPYLKFPPEKMQEKAMEIAREKGADAILFHDYVIYNDATRVSSVSHSDSVGKGLVTVNNTTVGPVISSGRDILFLKYQ